MRQLNCHLLLFCTLLLSAQAQILGQIKSQAQDRGQDRPLAGVSGGYSYLRLTPTPGLKKAVSLINEKSSSLHGWYLAGAVFLLSRFAIEAELSQHFGEIPALNLRAMTPVQSQQLRSFSNISLLVGPQFTAIRSSRIIASVSALFGFDHGKQSDETCCFYDGGLSGKHFAASFGGSIDLPLSERLAVRLIQPRFYILSGKLDLQGAQATTGNLVLSSGLVYRFVRK